MSTRSDSLFQNGQRPFNAGLGNLRLLVRVVTRTFRYPSKDNVIRIQTWILHAVTLGSVDDIPTNAKTQTGSPTTRAAVCALMEIASKSETAMVPFTGAAIPESATPDRLSISFTS